MLFKKKYVKIVLRSSETGKKIEVIKMPVQEYDLIMSACRVYNITIEEYFKQALENLVLKVKERMIYDDKN